MGLFGTIKYSGSVAMVRSIGTATSRIAWGWLEAGDGPKTRATLLGPKMSVALRVVVPLPEKSPVASAVMQGGGAPLQATARILTVVGTGRSVIPSACRTESGTVIRAISRPGKNFCDFNGAKS
jgi:hypothetical protein